MISGDGEGFEADKTAINFAIALTLSQVMSTFGAIQIICFQTMMNLKQPGNVRLFHQVLATILNAEVIDPDWTTKLLFDFEIDETYAEEMMKARISMMLQPQIYDMGFDSYNPILNCGGLYVCICLFIASMIALLVIVLIIQQLLKCNAAISNRHSLEGGADDDFPESDGESIWVQELQLLVLKLILSSMKTLNSLYFNPILVLI